MPRSLPQEADFVHLISCDITVTAFSVACEHFRQGPPDRQVNHMILGCVLVYSVTCVFVYS